MIFPLLALQLVLGPPVQQWEATRVARIGSLDGTAALTTVTAVGIGPSSAIFVAQPVEHTIRVFGVDGALLRTIGRRGKGPGEFEEVTYLGFLADTLYVSDQALRRVTFFDTAGTVIETAPIASPMLGSAMPRIIFPSVPQMMLQGGDALVYPSTTAAWVESGEANLPWLRIARDGRIADTLAWQHWALKNFGLSVAPQRSVGVSKPFPDHPLYAASRDGTGIIIVDRSVDQQHYTLAKIGLRGDTTYIRRFEYTPRQPTSDLVGRAVSRIQETVSQHFPRPTATTVRAALNDKELIPRTLPPITALASGSDGTIWLRREDSLDAMVPWHVMDQAGQPIAVVSLPAGEAVMAVNDRFIATLQEDALDVPYVTVYALQKPER